METLQRTINQGCLGISILTNQDHRNQVNFWGLFQSSSQKDGYSQAFNYRTSADVLVLAIQFGLHSGDLKSYWG